MSPSYLPFAARRFTWLFCITVAGMLPIAMVPVTVAADDARPNFVLIIADDISFNDLGCYGSKDARTPRLDQLAQEGLRMTNAFLTASSCSPSRASIITSRYPHNNGDAAELHRKISWHLPSVTGVLRDAGYYTALSGKNHMSWHPAPKDATPPQAAFDKIDNGRSPDKALPNSGGHANWVQTIQECPDDQPFMVWLASFDAHRDWDADGQWDIDLYGQMYDPATVTVPPAMVDTPDTRQDFASYLNEVTRFDYFVGQVVDELKQQELWSNTYLFVLADNGRPFPRAKTRMIDDGMQTYLILTGPEVAKPSATSDSLVSVIDIAPTILDFAGVDRPATFQGRSMRPIYADPDASIRPFAFSEHNWHDYEALGRAVRDDRWLYIENARPQFASQGPADSVRSPSHQDLLAAFESGTTLTDEQIDVLRTPRPTRELYDRATDPHQTRNLITDPEYATVAAQMQQTLDHWRTETGDSQPVSITPDTFDRQTGNLLKPSKSTNQSGSLPPPGADRQADRVNAKGLKE